MSDNYAFYETWGLNVETYDERTALEWGRSSNDAAYFVRQARQIGGPVLELGCGTGRITWPIAEAGIEIVGLDVSEPMIQHARAKSSHANGTAAERATFVLGTMAAFELVRTFRLIIIPFRAFQALLTPTEQRQCLHCIHRHLESDGRAIIDVFDPRLEYLYPGAGNLHLKLDQVRHPVSGNTVTVEMLAKQNDPLTQVLSERFRFTELDPRGQIVRQEERLLRLRWTYRHEMRYLFELTGFDVVAEYSDFEESPPAYGNEQLWLIRKH
jgi:SAM-dependent methyltransferase